MAPERASRSPGRGVACAQRERGKERALKGLRIAVGAAAALVMLLTSGCSAAGSADGIEDFDGVMASLEAKIPTRERASVRVCETLAAPDGQLTSVEAALTFVTESLTELQGSDDPNGMRNSLSQALLDFGDAALVGDPDAYASAGFNLATVCTDIVSGEYGK